MTGTRNGQPWTDYMTNEAGTGQQMTHLLDVFMAVIVMAVR
jgi:hypothetical protein